jgi:hypothetical protein
VGHRDGFAVLPATLLAFDDMVIEAFFAASAHSSFWHQAAVRKCPLFRCFWGLSGHRPAMANRSRFCEYTP